MDKLYNTHNFKKNDSENSQNGSKTSTFSNEQQKTSTNNTIKPPKNTQEPSPINTKKLSGKSKAAIGIGAAVVAAGIIFGNLPKKDKNKENESDNNDNDDTRPRKHKQNKQKHEKTDKQVYGKHINMGNQKSYYEQQLLNEDIAFNITRYRYGNNDITRRY